jgi:hypothetical protein
MEFEWDEVKAESNWQKHQVAFEDVLTIFLDPDRLEKIDDRRDYNEQRFILIGQVQDVVLTIVYTKRNSNLRIISARKAHRKERIAYEKSKTQS